MATIRVDVDGKEVADEIGKRIRRGIKKGASEVAEGVESRAKEKIRAEGAVFTRELLESFNTATVNLSGRSFARVRNYADHAPFQEEGVSGIVVKRNTPYSYKETKPPLDELIPWGLENLAGTGFWPDDLPDDGPPGD